MLYCNKSYIENFINTGEEYKEYNAIKSKEVIENSKAGVAVRLSQCMSIKASMIAISSMCAVIMFMMLYIMVNISKRKEVGMEAQ